MLTKFPALLLSAASLFLLPPPKVLGAGGKPAWEPHAVEQGDGRGGWISLPALKQSLTHQPAGHITMGFGLSQMDNGEVILLGGWNDGTDTLKYDVVCAFSRDRGDHWTNFSSIPGVIARAALMADLGKGNLMIQVDPMYRGPGRHAGPRIFQEQLFSSDYGRTWPERQTLQKATNGGTIHGPGNEGVVGEEGNALVDRGPDGRAVKIAEIGFNDEHEKYRWPRDAATGILRWSRDGGRTWYDESEPKAWHYSVTYQGREYERGTSEGSLVRAANGWIVAALRTDTPPRFFNVPSTDWVEGTGVSISKDDGATWSPIKVLYEAGRHHANLQRLPNGDLLMTLIVRADIENGAPRKTSYREGCEAILSHDNGLTWDLKHKYIIDSFYYFDPDHWYEGKCGHLASCILDTGEILTIYSNYVQANIVAVRWKL